MCEEFGRRLKSARWRARLNQVELAIKAKFDPSKISNFESGKHLPSIATLIKLADALNVSTDYLLGRNEDANFMSGDAQEFAKQLAGMNRPDRDLAKGIIELLKRNRWQLS